MIYKKSYLALLIASAATLSGCLSDNYDYGSEEGGNGASSELGLQVPLYHNDPKDYENPYVMYAVDADGNQTAVDGNALPSDSNINVTGDFELVSPLEVTVSDDKASLIFSANKAFDINKANLFNATANLGGSIQFYVNTLSYDMGDLTEQDEPNRVLLSIANGADKYSVDVTSAVIASTSGTAQFIRVPLNCYVDQGLDLSSVDMAMMLETEGAIEYEFSQARLANNSVQIEASKNNIQGCYNNNNSKVLTDIESILFRDTCVDESCQGNAAGFEPSGEALDVRLTRGNGVVVTNNGTDNGASRAQGIFYAEDTFETHRRSIMSFAIDKASELNDMTKPRLDVSQYMLNGEFHAEFVIPNNNLVVMPENGELELVLQFYGPGNNTEGMDYGSYGNSQQIVYNFADEDIDIDKGMTVKLEIPVKDFFTAPNGSVSLNALQYIEKLETHVQVKGSDGTIAFDELVNFRYGLGDIKFVLPKDNSPAAY